MRRQFRLPAGDEEYLQSLGVQWEAVIEGGSRWLLILNAVVPPGYNVACVLEAHLIDPNYPDTQIDMVYFFPALARTNGQLIRAVSTQVIDGKPFQRWSRHRTADNQWRRGIDDISTHRLLVSYWLEREVGSR